MAKQTFTPGQVLTAAQMTTLQTNDFNQTVSTKTASYVLVAADVGTKIVMNAGATNTTITVNTSLFAAGDTLTILNTSTSGTCTITAGTCTVATAGSLALGLNQGGTLYFTSAGVSVFQADGVSSTSLSYAIFNESQASGTDGGTFTSGSYVKRVLNTTVVNTISGCSLASSVITLPAGTYEVLASAPAYFVLENKAKLRNTTAGTDIALGQSSYSGGGTVTVSSMVQTYFTLAGSTLIELQHRCSTTRAGNGLGTSCGYGDNEIYSQITIIKVA